MILLYPLKESSNMTSKNLQDSLSFYHFFHKCKFVEQHRFYEHLHIQNTMLCLFFCRKTSCYFIK